MDHVPQATGSPHSPIKVPFVVTERFKPLILSGEDTSAEVRFSESGELFLEITRDVGTTPEILSTVIDILDFYQALCFFGLLKAFYSVAGKTLDIETYIDRSDKNRVLATTKNLLAELESIFLRQASLSLLDEAKIDKYIQIDNSMQKTQTLTFELQKYVVDSVETSQDSTEELSQRLTADQWMILTITESAAMLRETILTAARQTYLPSESVDNSTLAPIFGRDLPLAPDNILCMDRFRKAGWCPRQAAEAANRGLQSRSVLFSLSSIDRKNVSYGDHSCCSIDKCRLDSIDNDAYKPLHSLDCRGNYCPTVPAERRTRQNNVAAIIERSVMNGSIPAISVVETADSGPFLSIKSYRRLFLPQRAAPTSLGTQLSPQSFRESLVNETLVKLCNDHLDHNFSQEVEADNSNSDFSVPNRSVFSTELGIGTSENSLPYIAISHIWSQGLGNRGSNSLPLCQLRRLQHYVDRLVPPEFRPMPFWIDTICVPLDPAARNTAIQSMKMIYREAIAVLVVDSTLTQFDLSSTKSENGPVSGLQAWQVELLMRIKAAPWAERLWTYHEACLAKQLFLQVGGNGVAAIWGPDIVRIESYLAPEAFRTLQDSEAVARPRKRKAKRSSTKRASNPSNRRILMMPHEYTSGYLLAEAAALQLFGKSSPGDLAAQEFNEDLRYLSRQLSLRTTSRLQDEAICLSTLLGLEPSDMISDGRGKPVPDDKRMMRLWQVLEPGQVPAGILFCNRPTYDQPGSGWMVKSLLRDDMGNWIDGLGCGSALDKDPDLGLLVEMGGLTFEIEEDQKASGNYSPWDVFLNIAGFKYKLLKMEASAEPSEWRSSVNTGRFGILMPQMEMEALLENADYRVTGLGSHSSQLPSGLLVHLLDPPPRPAVETQPLGLAGAENALYVCRREMVEFEIVLEDEDSSDIQGDADSEGYDDGQTQNFDTAFRDTNTLETIIEIHVLQETQKWSVG